MAEELWGGETRKAVENFPVSGERVPLPVVRWLGRIKAAAARVNAELGLLDAGVAERIATAADAVAAGEHDDQFPIDVFQTGSGTSSNMNANEVIANLAGDGAHANDHVNMGQSSNDVFPSAVHLAALQEVTERAAPGARAPGDALAGQGRRVRRHREDRPHPPDGRGAGHARPGVRRLRRPDPPGPRPGGRRDAAALGADPARRDGDRHRPQHPPRVRRARAGAPAPRTPACRSGRPPTRSRRRAPATRWSRCPARSRSSRSRSPRSPTTSRCMGSGPRAGLAEIFLPELQKGSSIMPGKVNPVIPEVVLQVAAQVIGNDTAITDRRHAGQLRAERAHPAARPQPAALDPPAHHHVAPVRRQVRRGHRGRTCERLRGATPRATCDGDRPQPATSATTRAPRSSRRRPPRAAPLREVAREHGVDEEVLADALDLRKIAAGSSA